MKLLVTLAAIALLSLSLLTTGASAQHPTHQISLHQARALLLAKLPYAIHLDTQSARGSLASAADATPTTTDTNLPDPATILQERDNKFALIRSARYHEVVNDNQIGLQTQNIDATGDATCAPYLFARVTATSQVQGTSQKSTQKDRFEQYKKQGWQNTPKTKGKWVKAKPSSFQVFGFTIDNPLLCASSSSSSSSGNGTTTSPCGDGVETKDLNNIGQQTFAGLRAWHIRATVLLFDQSCNQIASGTLDYLVSTAQFLPLQYRVTLTDAKNTETLTLAITLKDFGAKIKRQVIKVGSKKP